MRRICSVVIAATLALTVTVSLTAGTAKAAIGYDSSYQFESAFLTLGPGDNGTFAVFFANTGSTAWVQGTGTQVNLAVCDSSKITCNVPSVNAAFASSWLSTTAYATHTKSVVSPGDFSPFSYAIKVPAGQTSGTYRFNGDLILAATGERIHPEGYYQDVTVAAPAVSLGVTPGFDANEDNEASSAVPGNGQHTYTFTSTLTGTLTFAILPSGNIQKNSDGTYSFCDTNQDKRADGVGGGSTLFTAFNGSSVPASPILVNEPIPTSGTMTVTIDSATRNERVRVVAWQDKNQNGQIDLTAAGADTTCNVKVLYDSTNDGVIAVSGRKFYFGPKGAFGVQFPDGSGNPQCEPVFRHDSTTQVFSAGPSTDTSLRYPYDSNDVFRIAGVQVTLSQFQAGLNPQIDATGSTVSIRFNPDPAGISEFNLCNTSGSGAPSNLTAASGNFDSGSTADDVRLSFTAPSGNQVTSYNIQRATVSSPASGANCTLGATPPNSDTSGIPTGSSFATIGSATVSAGQQGTFTNFDLANGGYCYRVSTTSPVTGQQSFSNYAFANVPGTGDAIPPTSTSTSMTPSSGGLSNTLDNGDKVTIGFSEQMSIASNAVIRVTDSDCGPATNAGPANCSGGTTNSVGDIICGTNATCTLDTSSMVVTITMTGNPSNVATGTTAGEQFPVVVTDSSGITDLSGNAWDLRCGTQTAGGAGGACTNGQTPKRVIP